MSAKLGAVFTYRNIVQLEVRVLEEPLPVLGFDILEFEEAPMILAIQSPDSAVPQVRTLDLVLVHVCQFD